MPRALHALVPYVPRALRALLPHVSRALHARLSCAVGALVLLVPHLFEVFHVHDTLMLIAS